MPLSRRARPERLVRWALGIFVLGLSAHLIARIGFEGDTWAMLGQADAALACARRGQWTGCHEAWHFPLLQILPSIAMRLAGIENGGTILRWLAHLSFASYWLILAATWRILSRDRGPTVALLGVLVLLSGYNMRYANLSFGEMLGAGLIFGLTSLVTVTGGAGRLAWLIAPFAFGAAVHKDTALPFLLLLAGVSALAARASGRKPDWQRLALLAAAPILAGFAASCGYNAFKFGTWYNVANLDGPGNVVRDPLVQLNSFAALWLSPHGGIAFFWPSFFAVLVAGGIFAARQTWSRERGIWLGTAVILGGLTLGFSKWYAPFGWHAWGPRLHLPWLPALSFVLLYAYGDSFDAALRAMPARRFALIATLWILLSWPQFRVVIEYQLANRVIESERSCTLRPEETPLAFRLRCGFPQLWPGYGNWALPTAFRPWPRPDLWLWCVFYSGFLAYGAACLWRHAKASKQVPDQTSKKSQSMQ